MKRTCVVLDETLVADCRKLTGIHTLRALINHALRELLRHGQQRKILELKSRVAWAGDLPERRLRRS